MKVYIIGQSNVGKSFLFNQLCNKSIAITQNEMNTTVDLISYQMGDVMLYDTPGMENSSILYKADLFLYRVRDSGIEELDKEILKNILKANIPVIVVAKDFKGLPSVEKYSYDNISALQARLNLGSHENFKPVIAIIGRENSGKSTLMNSILGYERCKVSEVAGTTKDSIVEEGTDFIFVDTAGYCREKTYMQKLISQKRQEILKESEGVILVLDGSKPMTKIEKQLMHECKIYSNFCIVSINKKDLLHLESKVSFEHFNFGNFPVVNICAQKNQINSLIFSLKKSYSNSQKVISTPKVNSWLNKSNLKFFDENNNTVKIKYLVQSGTNPIIFKYFSSRKISEKYEKFLIRSICENFKLKGVNIGVSFMKK